MIEMPQNTAKRDRISQAEIKKLIETREPYSISIFIPTHTTGEEVLQQQDALAFGEQLRQIRKELESRSIAREEIEKRLEPLEALRRDGAFWREQSEGLAVFAGPDWVKAYRLPISFQPQHRLSEALYLVPLAQALGADQEFYLLALELERIRLFHGTEAGMEEIPLEGRIPERMEDRVGYDYEEKGLQFRSQHQAHETAGYHGHAEADRDRKNEILRFFRAVDKGLEPILETEMPLVIASQEYLASIFRGVTSHPRVLEQTLIANLSQAKKNELWENALELLQPWLEQGRKEKWDRFQELHGTGKATTQLSRILKATLEGRVDSLFIRRDAEAWGGFDPNTGLIERLEEPNVFSGSLLNQALMQTLKQGGKVYLADPGEMPEGAETAAAVFRY